MGFRKDLTGQKFGRLTVTGFDYSRKGYNYYWHCICECGKTKTISRDSLIMGHAKSCGCRLWRGKPKHGMSNGGHIIYGKWLDMIQRCSNPKRDNFPIYGGRGIKVCEKWKTFENFRDDMLPTWREGLTLERIDSNKNYSPENCKWATAREQSRNRRSNHLLTYRNKTKCMIEWSEEFNIPYGTLWRRIVNLKWDTEKALNSPLCNK